jgi:hypothetical protein
LECGSASYRLPLVQKLNRLLQLDEAAGLPRHLANDFSDQWRRKAAATPFFITLLIRSIVKAVAGATALQGASRTAHSHIIYVPSRFLQPVKAGAGKIVVRKPA